MEKKKPLTHAEKLVYGLSTNQPTNMLSISFTFVCCISIAQRTSICYKHIAYNSIEISCSFSLCSLLFFAMCVVDFFCVCVYVCMCWTRIKFILTQIDQTTGEYLSLIWVYRCNLHLHLYLAPIAAVRFHRSFCLTI